jgi:hypothetical protein
MAIAYGTALIIFAAVRAAMTINAEGGVANGLVATTGETVVALATAGIAIALILALPAAIIGTATALSMKVLIDRFDGGGSRVVGMAIGAITAFVAAAALHWALYAATGFSMATVQPQTYWFWLGGPSVVQIIVGAIEGIALASRSSTMMSAA